MPVVIIKSFVLYIYPMQVLTVESTNGFALPITFDVY